MNLILLLCAIALSSTAAYYSIAGLIAIFSALPIPIMIMGSVLEVSKLVVASWLYRNWKDTSIMLRTYFIAAIVTLMLLTSMGIFGLLSRAHADQSLVVNDASVAVSVFNDQIQVEKENIDANRKTLAQLDAQVNETLSRSIAETGALRSVSVRRTQNKEREKIKSEILLSQKRIVELTAARAEPDKRLRNIEAEVGPIKYIAALIYGDSLDQNVLEKSVRVIILMIVFAFDPLAVLMFIAYNQSIMRSVNLSSTTPPMAENMQELKDQLVELSNITNPNQEQFANNMNKVKDDIDTLNTQNDHLQTLQNQLIELKDISANRTYHIKVGEEITLKDHIDV